ncbi:MAG TPA: hypothetical protein VFX17_02965 [Patescibacteria group bacterium]|nr:hypothetical protein [Patescibacteria group bacterium]
MKKFIVLMAVLVWAANAQAQSLQFNRTPLSVAVVAIAHHFSDPNHPYFVVPDSPMEDLAVTNDVRGLSLDAALARILSPLGFEARISGDKIHIRLTNPQPARTETAVADHPSTRIVAAAPRVYNPFQACIQSGPFPGTPDQYVYCNRMERAQENYSVYGYGYARGARVYGGGYYGYQILSPEPCQDFPGNRRCVMGKVKIDYQTTVRLVRSRLQAAGLPDSTDVSMYSMPVDPRNGKVLSAIESDEGPVTKHNNWFNDGYRIEAGSYLLKFKTADGRLLFQSFVTIRSDYYTDGHPLFLQVASR